MIPVPPRMRARLDDYERLHTHRSNEICHWIGIPLIVAGTAALLGAVPLVPSLSLSVTELLLSGAVVFYVVEARALGVLTSICIVGIAALGRLLPALGGLGLFLIGWALQLIGHSVFEKRSPAFLGNLLHLLVGPAWLVDRAVRAGSLRAHKQRPR